MWKKEPVLRVAKCLIGMRTAFSFFRVFTRSNVNHALLVNLECTFIFLTLHFFFSRSPLLSLQSFYHAVYTSNAFRHAVLGILLLVGNLSFWVDFYLGFIGWPIFVR